MKTLLTILTLAIVLSSCAIFQSRETRAQNHLGKAIKLDPSIIKSTQKDSVNILDSIRITDSIRVKDSVVVTTKDSTIIVPKSDLNGIITDPCDSIKGLQPFDYVLGSGVHRLHIWSDGKKIYYSSTVDSLVSYIQSKDTYILREKKSWQEKEKIYLETIEKLQKDVLVVKPQENFFQRAKRFLLIFIPGLVLGYVLRLLFK